MFPYPTFNAGSGRKPIGLAYVGSGTWNTNTDNLTWPASSQPGDLAIVSNYAGNSAGTPAAVTPAGFTTLASLVSGTVRAGVFCKIVKSGDTGVINLPIANIFNDRTILLFRGDRPITTVVPVAPFNAQLTDAAPAQQTVLVAGETPTVLVFGYGSGQGWIQWTANPAWNTAVDGGLAPPKVSYQIYNSGTPINQTATIGDAGNLNCLITGGLLIG